jgi:hypothetical protein
MTDHGGRCTAAQTPALREAVGAYVLGALDSTETDQVTAHLADCHSCREEYLELLELLPLLATVTEAGAVNGPVRPGPDVLGRLLSSWRRDSVGGRRDPAGRGPLSRRPNGRGGPSRRSRRSKYALAAAGAVIFAGICAIGLLVPAGRPDTSTAWSATAAAGPSRADPDADATASVRVSATTWGSAISLTIEHVPEGYECTMIVVASDGHREDAGTWKARTDGTFTFPGTAGIDPDQIASIQVELLDGTTLVTLDRP